MKKLKELIIALFCLINFSSVYSQDTTKLHFKLAIPFGITRYSYHIATSFGFQGYTNYKYLLISYRYINNTQIRIFKGDILDEINESAIMTGVNLENSKFGLCGLLGYSWNSYNIYDSQNLVRKEFSNNGFAYEICLTGKFKYFGSLISYKGNHNKELSFSGMFLGFFIYI
jgi:hypothetical protein